MASQLTDRGTDPLEHSLHSVALGNLKSAQVFEATDHAPEVLLVLGPNNTAHLAPLIGLELQPMAGGNFAYTSDSRLRDFFDQLGVSPFYGAIAVHDRFESWPSRQHH